MRQRITAIVILSVGCLLIATLSSANDHWTKGLEAFNEEHFETAAEHFEAVTKTNPSWPGGYYMLGRCRLEMGDGAQAVTLLGKAHDLDPKDGSTVIALGRALLSEQDWEAIAALLTPDAIDALPGPLASQAVGLLASGLLQQDKSDEAVKLLDRRVAVDEDDPGLFRLLGQAYKNLGDNEQAYQNFGRSFALDHNETTGSAAVQSAIATAGAQADPDRRKMWYLLAADMALNLAEHHAKAEYFSAAGRTALAAGDAERARQSLEDALKLDESDARAAYLLGRSFMDLGRDAEAEQALKRALSLGPDSDLETSIHGKLGRLAACDLNLAQAAVHYRAAGQTERADEIEALASQFSDALSQLNKLRGKIAEIKGMEKELEALGDAQGVAAMREQAEAEQANVNAIEANLEQVRSALCQ